MESLKRKTIAIASGKGGVGKTTTSANIALYCADKGIKTAIIDVDPLSDIASILDLPESHRVSTNGFKDLSRNVFPNLDLILPDAKTGGVSSAELMERLYSEFSEELNERYDLIIFDMPAGLDDKENIDHLKKANTLLLVTNPEPTAHVSAGGYIKKVLEKDPDRNFILWHNKYSSAFDLDFNTTDIIGNYNKNVSSEDQITSPVKMKDLAFIAKDPTLDLLNSDPSINLNLQRDITEILDVMLEIILPTPAKNSIFGAKSYDMIRYYIKQKPEIGDITSYISDIESSFTAFLSPQTNNKETKSKNSFSHEQELELKGYLLKVKNTPLRTPLIQTRSLIKSTIDKLENSKSTFGFKNVSDSYKMIDKAIFNILMEIHTRPQLIPLLGNFCSMLLFQFSLLKLIQSETIYSLIIDFIPRKDVGKFSVRDRNKQIDQLMSKNDDYRSRYTELVKTLFPVVVKQIVNIVKTFELKEFYFKNKEGKLNSEAYLKLFSNFLHDTIYSGLGVAFCFRFRPASIAFNNATEELLNIIKKSA